MRYCKIARSRIQLLSFSFLCYSNCLSDLFGISAWIMRRTKNAIKKSLTFGKWCREEWSSKFHLRPNYSDWQLTNGPGRIKNHLSDDGFKIKILWITMKQNALLKSEADWANETQTIRAVCFAVICLADFDFPSWKPTKTKPIAFLFSALFSELRRKTINF